MKYRCNAKPSSLGKVFRRIGVRKIAVIGKIAVSICETVIFWNEAGWPSCFPLLVVLVDLPCQSPANFTKLLSCLSPPYQELIIGATQRLPGSRYDPTNLTRSSRDCWMSDVRITDGPRKRDVASHSVQPPDKPALVLSYPLNELLRRLESSALW